MIYNVIIAKIDGYKFKKVLTFFKLILACIQFSRNFNLIINLPFDSKYISLQIETRAVIVHGRPSTSANIHCSIDYITQVLFSKPYNQGEKKQKVGFFNIYTFL